MPPLTIYSIRLSLLYLVTGWAVGAVLMINRAWAFSGQIWHLLGVHMAFVLFGWTLQFVIAVAYWMLPTFGGRTNRGREWAAWGSVVTINLGVLWIVFGGAMIVSAISWLVATLLFLIHAWPRIKSFG